MTTDSVPAHDELATELREEATRVYLGVNMNRDADELLNAAADEIERLSSLLASARADGARDGDYYEGIEEGIKIGRRDAIEQIDGELQQRTVYAEPYAGWKEPVDEAEGGYRRGYVSGLTSAFTEFRHISARAAVPLTERNNE